MSEHDRHEPPCRLCGQGTRLPHRLCAQCTRTLALHHATITAAPDQLLDEEVALARLIIQRQQSWARANPSPSLRGLDSAVVVELESAGAASAFMIWTAGDFRRYGRTLIDLAENDDDFDAVHFNVHDELELFGDQHDRSTRQRGQIRLPAAVAVWAGNLGRSVCAVRIEHAPGSHPSQSIGQAAWSRIECAIRACGIDLDPAGRTVRFAHGPAPDIAHADTGPHPADLAVMVALLVDAEVLDPAICEDAVFSAQLGSDGTLFPHPVGIPGLSRWATEGAWSRLHLADLDADAMSATGLEIWGYEHLGDLIDTWRPGRDIATAPEPHDDRTAS